MIWQEKGDPTNKLLCKFYATLVFKHSDWLFKIFLPIRILEHLGSVNLRWKIIYRIRLGSFNDSSFNNICKRSKRGRVWPFQMQENVFNFKSLKSWLPKSQTVIVRVHLKDDYYHESITWKNNRDGTELKTEAQKRRKQCGQIWAKFCKISKVFGYFWWII